jgi:hypothetical protein
VYHGRPSFRSSSARAAHARFNRSSVKAASNTRPQTASSAGSGASVSGRAAVAFPPAVVVHEKVEQRRFQEVAEAAALVVGPLKVAACETEGEILKQIVGRMAVAHRGQQAAVNRRFVAAPQLFQAGTV